MTRQTVLAKGGGRLPPAIDALRTLIDVHERAGSGAGRADRVSALVLGVGYVVVAVVCGMSTWTFDQSAVIVAVPLVALYAIAYRTEFVSASGSSVPTQPILVGMLLLLPLAAVPLTVLAGLQFGGTGALRSAQKYDPGLLRWVTGWHCLGPVAVLWAAGVPASSLEHWPIYLAALAAQFAVDSAVAVVRTMSLGIPARQLIRPLTWTFATDSLMAPIGLCIVIAGAASPATTILLAAPIALVWLLARDRTEHLAAAVSLSTAFTVVQEEARLDPLTGLANRRAWEEAMDQAGARIADRTAVSVTVLAADLDGLKKVNDTLGHEAGDSLIAGMAEVLRAAIPEATVVARLGGDEFGVIVVNETRQVDPARLISAVRSAMAVYRGADGITLSASLGAATTPPEPSVHEAARTADTRAASDKSERRAERRRAEQSVGRV